MNSEKMERIAEIVRKRYPSVTSEIVADYCAGPWEDDPEAHEEWLRTAPDAEIAGWVAGGYPWVEEEA